MNLPALSDIQSLKCMIHASPSYHQVYAVRWRSILSSVLTRDLGPQVLMDAFVVLQASGIVTAAGSRTEIKEFLAQYWRDRGRARDCGPETSLHDAASLSRMHITAQALAMEFYHSAISAHPSLSEQEVVDVGSSMTELLRI